MAGDMTIWGRRDNVKIIREDAEGNKRIIPMNLNEAEIVFSPDFYLQQNDVVYVEPNKTKAQNAAISNATGLWVSATSIHFSCQLFNILNDFMNEQPYYVNNASSGKGRRRETPLSDFWKYIRHRSDGVGVGLPPAAGTIFATPYKVTSM